MPKSLLTFFFLISTLLGISQPDLVYLKNKKEFAFHGKSGEVQSFNMYKNAEIVILSEKGIQLFENFAFPEAIDPLYEDLAAPIRNHHKHFTIHKINQFELRVKRDNSYLATYNKFDKVTRERFLDDATLAYNASYTHQLNVKNLKIGDVIKLEYEITVLYSENLISLRSWRLFIHELYPSEETELRIRYHKDLNMAFAFQNNGEPTKSYGKEEIILKWTAENLSGAVSEPNGRPYLTLPYIEIFINNAPIYWPARYRFAVNHLLEDQMSIKLGYTGKQFQLLNEFNAKTSNSRISRIQRLKQLSNSIALDYEYDNDSSFFSGERLTYMPKFGSDLNNKKLRESNKYQIYNNLLYSSDVAYGALFIADVRTSSISDYWMQPIYNSDFIFMPFTADESCFIYPKSQQCGCFTDELPYFYENAIAEFVLVDPEVFPSWKSRHQKEFEFVRMPSSSLDSNLRTTMLEIKLDKKSGEYQVNFNITLKGQFSTLYRPLYKCNEALLHSDSIYHKKLWSDMDVENLAYNTEVKTDSFPYTTIVSGSFTTKSLEKLHLHPEYEISLQMRTLPYYTDFVGRDNFVIKLNQADLVQIPKDKFVRNEFGRYVLKTETSTNETIVYSSLNIVSREVNADAIETVGSIYKNAASISVIFKTK
jgi:hypothetical protein